jgi:exodeoxyribonuclease V gamma subunit
LSETSETITPGLMVLHGNRLEELRDVLAGWLQREPLAPLENEVVLVQSNGIAQWFKLALARDRAQGGLGISAAVDVQLPGRFLWIAYRAVLGRDAVPPESPFDKSRLVWRLLRLLPQHLDRASFRPLRDFLGDDEDASKRYQLAHRLADLYDQYQVYRADWLDDWAAGRDVLRDDVRGCERVIPAGQQWQPELWRLLLDDVGTEHRDGHRAAVHSAFVRAIGEASVRPRALPRRIVVFGMSSLPQQTLEALSALGRWCQVLLVVMNPCRHYWADIVEDRELLLAERRRQAQKPGMPASPDDQEMHLHAHPLLAAWGKQGRDYIRLLDAFDHADSYRERFTAWDQRIDLFSDAGEDNLLRQVQQAILDLEPLPADETARPLASPDDASIVFHIAHGAQREVEILHDQLLARFAKAAEDGVPLLPRDVIVMVPDIQAYAPHIEAVFGRIDRHDPRYIPFSVADRMSRGTVPLIVALDSLLGLPESRFTVSDLVDLLDVPALRQRFNIGDDDLPALRRWIEGAGIRWGLDAAQRASLDLPALEQNTWVFGLRRMLLGYAVGAGEAWREIEPYDEVGGLDAALVGPLADLLGRLQWHLNAMRVPTKPSEWVTRLRDLLRDFFIDTDPVDAARLSRLGDVLEQWERACLEAGLDESLPLNIVREAWLDGFDEGSLSQRFLAGSVSFGTLMPMRAIPFRLVCLLGMNDGDYPRARPPLDFDLMARQGAWRPGDRSRREDDRYLFLEALLSARDALHVSWVGRSARDNGERPPSVLVGQLRDYLAAGWRDSDGGDGLLDTLSVVHPLQPFSRTYFSANHARDSRLFTFAREWRQAHDAMSATDHTLELSPWDADTPLSRTSLRTFLRHPVRHFFNQRLRVFFDVVDETHEDLEPFALDALQRYQLTESLLGATVGVANGNETQALALAGERMRRSGVLPLAGFAEPAMRDLSSTAEAVDARYRRQLALWPIDAGKREVQIERRGLRIEDWLTDLRGNANGTEFAVLSLSPSGLLGGDGQLKHYRLIGAWIDHLLAHAEGLVVHTYVIGPDVSAVFAPIEQEQACRMLDALLDAWKEAMRRPLPVAAKTALAWVAAEGNPDEDAPRQAAERCYDAGGDWRRGEVDGDPYLGRTFGDFVALERAGLRDWLGLYRDLFRAAHTQADA